MPHLQVLPWDDNTSWDNFCTIVKSWKFRSNDEDDNTMWYKRSTYRILNNMISNLRQSGSARTLLMKWRSMMADSNEEPTCETIERNKQSHKSSEKDMVVGTDELADDMSILRELLRQKFGVDDKLTFRQRQNLEKANAYMEKQLTSLNFIHRATVINVDQYDVKENKENLDVSIPTISQRPYLCYTVNECITLRQSITSNVEHITVDDNKNGTVLNGLVDNSDVKSGIAHNVQILQTSPVDIILSSAQIKIVTALKDSIEGGQLLGYLQGFPGAGKTTTAKKMQEATGLRVLYCGSTGTASAHFKSKTINSLLSLGLSVDNINLATETTSAQTITKIVRLMDEYHLLLVDEASMLTPVTLARMDLRLRHCFDPNLPFGGKHILLCGDMWQFPPVSDLFKPALYQAAVVVATNKKVPNEAYRAGANLFTQFKLFVLNDQQRCEPDYAKFLEPLRDMKIKHPITKEWLSKLKVLSSDDVTKPDSKWRFATVAVTGNVERLAISRYKAKLFGKMWCEPIVTWICKVKCGVHGRRILYDTLDVDESTLTGKYSILQEYFVRGAPCVLAENLSTEQQLAKGTKGIFESLVWDPKDCKGQIPDLNILPRGEISHVPQPRFVIINVDGRLIPIQYRNAKLEKTRKTEIFNYRAHPVDLLFAVTYHKLQGLNLDALVLSINKHTNPKLRLTLPSLYVGASRVHNLDQLRVLPFWKEDADYLMALKTDPLLKLWFENYTTDGIWKSDGLQTFAEGLRKKEIERLALVEDLSFFTGQELRQYAKNLDLHVGSSNKPKLLQILTPFYEQGREYITANKNHLMKQLRSDLLLKLRQKGKLGKLKITVLKSFAKRLGFDTSLRINRRNLERSLEKLMDDGVPVCDLPHQIWSRAEVNESDKKNLDPQSNVELLEEKVKTMTLTSSHETELSAASANKDGSKTDNNVQCLLDAKASASCTQTVINEPDNADIALQICKIFKNYSLNITGTITLPDGHTYDRIFNMGGGNCYFYSVCQGLEFFGLSMDHVELRTKVGGWLQNPYNAHLMEMGLELLPADLYDHLRHYPPPEIGWANYLNGMTWQDWGVHVQLLGEWVGPMEITPTNHVLEEMGTDIRVNIFDPMSRQIFGNEENQRSDGIDKPIIMIMSFASHFEWLRLRTD